MRGFGRGADVAIALGLATALAIGLSSSRDQSRDGKQEERIMPTLAPPRPGARPCAIGWIRDIVGQCRAAGVPVFVKQLGARPVRTVRGSWINGLQRHGPDIQQPYGRAACWACRTEECKLLWPGVPPHVKRWLPLRDRKGGDMSEWPEDMRVREWPL